jgi:hypothetical protein
MWAFGYQSVMITSYVVLVHDKCVYEYWIYSSNMIIPIGYDIDKNMQMGIVLKEAI